MASDVVTAVEPVVAEFEVLGVSYRIGGSVASSAHGVPRSTLDVDLVCDLRLVHVDRLVARLQDAYYVDAAPAQSNLPEWAALIAGAQGTRRLGSAALDLCFVACGWLDVYWERMLHPWDLVAGAAIVEAAGGRATEMDGTPFDECSAFKEPFLGASVSTKKRCPVSCKVEMSGSAQGPGALGLGAGAGERGGGVKAGEAAERSEGSLDAAEHSSRIGPAGRGGGLGMARISAVGRRRSAATGPRIGGPCGWSIPWSPAKPQASRPSTQWGRPSQLGGHQRDCPGLTPLRRPTVLR